MEEGGLGIKSLFIEKDYWITRALKLMAAKDSARRAVFRGDTSLTKVYKIGNRFSEDIDVAITDAESLKDGQKKIIARIVHNMSSGIEEIPTDGQIRKSSKYRKEFLNICGISKTFYEKHRTDICSQAAIDENKRLCKSIDTAIENARRLTILP